MVTYTFTASQICKVHLQNRFKTLVDKISRYLSHFISALKKVTFASSFFTPLLLAAYHDLAQAKEALLHCTKGFTPGKR